ncbi:multiple organellar RNA editing factor 3, mitochondrial [Argentina anserina]|uniref:multiple organellar RNA editing factor 3, mitochondrial n=1 Tax=Argentina anserina TaxID=57926 RepID=UPI002176863C|nr:multiple organellar RNA editing factor 3, mitochondrial [Potentilla anserina]
MAYSAVRRTLATALTTALTTTHSARSNPSFSSRSRFTLALLNTQQPHLVPDLIHLPTRSKTTEPGYSPLKDTSPNWNNRPPKETILLDGCDYEHWLIVLDFKDPKPSEQEMIDRYVKTLATVVGSEEEARKKIYSVSTTTYTGFGALISEEDSNKLKGAPDVIWILPDSYLDVPKKDYGGDLYIDGKVIPRPQYRFNEHKNNNRNKSRPRHDRRREEMPVERRLPEQN